jgi:cytochrome oxidase assembly protein ShyY1
VRQLWLRWVLLVVGVAVLGAVFVNLGQWQLERLDQRKQRNAITLTNEQSPAQTFPAVFTRPIGDADQWLRVEAHGTFDPDHQFLVRYRNNGDAKGYEVVTPLRTANGTVLVDRGFVAVPQGTQIPSAAPLPPAGEVTVVGHVRRNEHGRRGAVQPVNAQIRLINSDALAPALPYPVVNGYLGALTIDPAQSGDFRPIPLPEISDGPHFWYAVQWFMFTGIGIAGIVVFIRGDVRERRAKVAAERPDAGVSADQGAGPVRAGERADR